MRYATFSLSNDPKQQLGVVRNDRLLNLGKLVGPRVSDPIPGSLREFIEQGPQAWRRMKSLVESEESGSGTSRPDVFPRPEDVHLHAPIPRPAKNVMCLGLNYALHIEESARARGREVKIPEVPVFFTKAPTSVTGPYDPIPWDPSVTAEVDWEAELGIVIGVGGKNISRENAMEHVFGFTIIN